MKLERITRHTLWLLFLFALPAFAAQPPCQPTGCQLQATFQVLDKAKTQILATGTLTLDPSGNLVMVLDSSLHLTFLQVTFPSCVRQIAPPNPITLPNIQVFSPASCFPNCSPSGIPVTITVAAGTLTGSMTITFQRCCTPPSAAFCVHSVHFWKKHNRFAPNLCKRIPWPLCEETPLCGFTWLEILKIKHSKSDWILLAQQWIATQLNIAMGAAIPNGVEEAFLQAGQLLSLCQTKVKHNVQFEQLANILRTYNEGHFVGFPPECRDPCSSSSSSSSSSE